jgi:hypothetical protein
MPVLQLGIICFKSIPYCGFLRLKFKNAQFDISQLNMKEFGYLLRFFAPLLKHNDFLK